ncbi:hypothetical protein Tco_1510929 [Tanacetum coccineum]
MIQNVCIILKKWSPDAFLSKEGLTKGRGSFARTLIKLDVTCGLNDRLVVAIPKCDNFPKKPSTSDTQSKSEKQKDVQNDDFQSVKRKTSKGGNWESQGKHQGSEFDKSTNGFYRSIVKPKSSTLVSNSFYALEEDSGNSMDDLVNDTKKKIKAPPRKTGVWLGRKAERNIAFSFETNLHYCW